MNDIELILKGEPDWSDNILIARPDPADENSLIIEIYDRAKKDSMMSLNVGIRAFLVFASAVGVAFAPRPDTIKTE